KPQQMPHLKHQLRRDLESFLSPFIVRKLKAYNAALRGECRINQPSADHFHHKNHRRPKMPRGMNPA
ncbi:hypothetical protein, partial [Vibrio vulnificus]|uniref:hypothetical protein n=1 Tax=Vibrio vulnificus TaxID=672 RepID=UPI0039C99E63